MSENSNGLEDITQIDGSDVLLCSVPDRVSQNRFSAHFGAVYSICLTKIVFATPSTFILYAPFVLMIITFGRNL